MPKNRFSIRAVIPASGAPSESLDELRLPLLVNVREIVGSELEQLIHACQKGLGAKHFRGAELFNGHLAERREAARPLGAFLFGPYLSLFVRPNGQIGLGVRDSIPEGLTVYSADQLIDFCGRVNPRAAAEQVKASLGRQENFAERAL